MHARERWIVYYKMQIFYLLRSIINIKISKYFQIPFWKLELVSRQPFGC